MSILRTYFSYPAKMAYNVLVVNEGLAARISETEGFAGLTNFGGEKHHKGCSSA